MRPNYHPQYYWNSNNILDWLSGRVVECVEHNDVSFVAGLSERFKSKTHVIHRAEKENKAQKKNTLKKSRQMYSKRRQVIV